MLLYIYIKVHSMLLYIYIKVHSMLLYIYIIRFICGVYVDVLVFYYCLIYKIIIVARNIAIYIISYLNI